MTTDWDTAQAQRIGAAIKSLRGDRSAQWLSDQTALAGHAISRSTIADIENRRRRYVSTAELCVLAWSLKVPPIRLIYPDLPDGPVEFVPGRTVTSIVAAAWFSGETVFYPEIDPEAVDADERRRWASETTAISDGAQLVELSRERMTLESRIESLAKIVGRLRNSEDPSLADSFVSEVAAAQSHLKTIADKLQQTMGAVLGGSDGG